MSRTLGVIGIVASALFCVADGGAHHSGAGFDLGSIVTLRGLVTRYLWRNPHVYIDIDSGVDDEDRPIWVIEGFTPASMARMGWSEDSLAPGDFVSIEANPPKNPDDRMARIVSLLKADGTALTTDNSTAYQAFRAGDLPKADGLSGQWLTRFERAKHGRFFRRSQSPLLTEKGNAALAAYDEAQNPGLDCVSQPGPYFMTWPHMTSIEIGEEVTLIRNEVGYGGDGFPEARRVHMNVDSHEGAVYTNRGHSIGHWEDDVFIVDTTHFADHRSGHGYGLPSGAQKHAVERFELKPDGSGITYTFWVEDPEYMAEPETATLDLVYRPDLPFFDVPCDPDVARRALDSPG
jgi:hypothetical protein